MIWLKYYTGVIEESDEVAAILEKFGHDGFGKYWHLMGILGKKFNEGTETILLTNRFLRERLRFKSKKKLSDFLLSTEIKTVFNTVEVDNDFLFETSILLELKSRDFKATRSQREDTAYKNKIKKKNKIKSKNNNNKGLFLEADELLSHWNTLGIKPENPTPHLLRKIADAYRLREDFGTEGNKQAFNNYAAILKSPKSWWSVTYSCSGFLENKGTTRFYPGEFNETEYMRPGAKGNRYSGRQTAEEKLNNVLNMENPYESHC